jgi:hypothetical protein
VGRRGFDGKAAAVAGRGESVINVPTMSETHDQHLEFFILNPAQNAVVIDTIAPEFAEVSLEALSELPGIVTTRNAGIEKRKNPP